MCFTLYNNADSKDPALRLKLNQDDHTKLALWSHCRLTVQCGHICSPPERSLTQLSLQMEDDVEVELELEKQLALAHELFPT